MSLFHPLVVKDIRNETQDCVSISLNIPDDLKSTFNYSSGQYLTFKKVIDGKEVRRSYSLCSAPHESEWRVAVKKVEDGLFSTFANEVLKPGDILETMKPDGLFTFKPDAEKPYGHYLTIAAGSGITPILSIIKTVLWKEPNSRISLLYGNRYTSSIIFREELEGLKDLFLDRFQVDFILSRERTDSPLFQGRLDESKCDSFFNTLYKGTTFDQVFLCGPGDMIFNLKEHLPTLGIDKNKIHFELFTPPGEERVKKKRVRKDDSENKSNVELRLDGNIFKLNISQNDNILDAAVDAGIDMPYSCKSGVCSTCRAHLLEGEVDLEVNYALEPDELKAGFILTCQSYPRSQHLKVDYDKV